MLMYEVNFQGVLQEVVEGGSGKVFEGIMSLYPALGGKNNKFLRDVLAIVVKQLRCMMMCVLSGIFSKM